MACFFDQLPYEILQKIATYPGGFRALLAYPRFARGITQSDRIDYMIADGVEVEVTANSITWMRYGVIHRIGGPACERIWYDDMISIPIYFSCAEGPVQIWYINGVITREDGPAITHANGEYWIKHGDFHRIGGPAFIEPYRKMWYENGELHRTDGPAVESASGNLWYYRGKKMAVVESNWTQNIPYVIGCVFVMTALTVVARLFGGESYT